MLLNGNKFCPRLKVWPEVFGQIGAVRSACLLVCCLATRHRRRANNDNNNSGKINNNKSNTKSATAIELSSIHWSIRLAHAARYVWRILNCACAAALGVGTWRSWGSTVLYAQARSGSKHRPEPDTEPGHYAWHPYSLWAVHKAFIITRRRNGIQ